MIEFFARTVIVPAPVALVLMYALGVLGYLTPSLAVFGLCWLACVVLLNGGWFVIIDGDGDLW